MRRRKISIAAVALTLLLGACSSNRTQDASLKQGAKDVGRAVGTAAREVGQEAKKVGKMVAEAAKEGGQAFKEAVKGD
jgi:hypothetical protein